MQEFIDALLALIRDHGLAAALVVFSIAFLESMAIIGLLVPGALFFVGVGSLIGAGYLDFYWMSLASFIGAVLGESASFYLGFFYRDRIRHWSFMERHRAWLTKSEHFFERYGVISIMIGRFFGPLRAVMPLMAGIAEMPKRAFLLANCVSAVFWAPLYFIPGIVLGAVLTFDDQAMTVLLLMFAGLSLFLYLSWLYAREWWRAGHPYELNALSLKLLVAVACLGLTVVVIAESPHQAEVNALFQKIWQVLSR